MAYNPCKNKNVNSGTTYQHQQRYLITKKKDLTCPLTLFWKHLLKQIKLLRAVGDRIIPFMEDNKHMVTRALGKALSDKDGLDLREAVIQHTKKIQEQHSSVVLSQSLAYGYQVTLTSAMHVWSRPSRQTSSRHARLMSLPG
jgi:hypothetical protein